MNNNNGLKRVLEIVLAVILAFVAFQLLGFVFSAIIFAIRVLLSLIVFGAVVALLDWALFRHPRVRG